MKRFLLSLGIATAIAGLVFAQSTQGETSFEFEGDYEFPNHAAVDASGLVPIVYSVIGGNPSEPRSVGSTWGGGEAKAIIDRRLVFPVLAGAGPLTQGNNLALDLSGEVSPVSLNANFQATLTPIAFLKLDAGGGIGTGWNIGFVGLGVIDQDGDVVPQDFGGIVYRAWVEGTFQFDLAALFPGDWNHLVVLASDKAEFQAYTGADASTAWIWEADSGMDFNGWQLYGSYFLGYQMPLALDTVGFLVQTQGWLGSVRDMAPSDGSAPLKWGSDFTYLFFGPLFDFKIDGKSSIAILPQFKTGIQWTDQTKWLNDFQDRVYEGSYVYFYRIAFDYSLKL